MKVTVMRRWRIKPQGSEGVYSGEDEYVNPVRNTKALMGKDKISNGVKMNNDIICFKLGRQCLSRVGKREKRG